MEYLSKISKEPITLRMCSPGGSVDHGLVLYDYIKASKVPIHVIVSGMAASMAAILLGAGKKGKRYATKNSRIMIHQPSSGFLGKAIDIEIHAKEVSRLRHLLNSLLSEDTGQPLKKVSKDTESDYWMTAEEAKKYGLVDKVI
jgi:ATP-dependent Clp protease protease subunit